MPANRPEIPINIKREVLIESGHRCAVCGENCPLEHAHIIPWSKVREHKLENLICLCANCHSRADKEKWGEKTLQQYKERPWILRRFDREDFLPIQRTKVEIRIQMEIENFTDRERRLLTSGVAGFLEISPTAVQMIEIEEGSVRVVFELPSEGAEQLVSAYENDDQNLKLFLESFTILDIKKRGKIYVGTIVGESTSREFRLAVAHEEIREQDIIVVEAELRQPGNQASIERIRVWAKVQSIERLNPLFPSEAGHELAATKTNPFDTVLSLSREMVTAVCQVLGVEPIDGSGRGKLDQLRYPPQPASSAYRPNSEDIARVVVGELQDKQNRALDLATLANRTEVDVKVDGHAIVSRHLAILAMTGAGKSVTSRRIIEELSNKNYPIIIFDPHGDYTGLKEVSQLESRVKLYYADLPIWDGSFDDAIKIINGLSGEELSIPQEEAFESVFSSRKTILSQSNISSGKIKNFLYNVIQDSRIQTYPIQRDLFALAYICDAVGILGKKVSDKEERDASASFIDEFSDLGFEAIRKVDGRSAGTFKALARKLRRSAFALREMENINRSRAGNAEPLPIERLSLINYGQISVISLAGYTELLQATLYTLIAKDLFRARVQGSLPYQYFMVLEEAHNFVPSKSDNPAIVRSIGVTKQIAQEGRKFGVGLLLISQRPSRLDETTLAMCNSYIIMRMVNPADQNFVRKVVESLGEDEAKMLPDLDVGEAILSGQLINFPVLVRIKKPQSSGEREERDAFEVLEEANRAAKPNRSRR